MAPRPGDDLTDRRCPAGPTPGVGGTRLRLRYPGVCGCGTALPVGVVAVWDRIDRRVWCLPCARPAPAQSGAEPGPGAARRAGAAPARPVPVAVADSGRAGASLHRTYDARRAARENRVRSAHPRLGGLLLAVSGEPASTAACGTEVLFLHNRRLGPGRRDGDLDHVAVAPGGVFVIDAKNVRVARVSIRVCALILRQPGGRRTGSTAGPARSRAGQAVAPRRRARAAARR